MADYGEEDFGDFGAPEMASAPVFSGEDDLGDEDRMPRSYSNALDQYSYKKQRQAHKLEREAIERPAWNVNGQLTRQAPNPQDFNWYQPIQGERQVVGSNVDFTPIQQRMADAARAEIPRITSRQVVSGADQAYAQMLQENGNKPVNMDVFDKSKRWDDLRTQGIPEEQIDLIKRTLYPEIKKRDDYFREVTKFSQLQNEIANDPIAQILTPRIPKGLSMKKQQAALQFGKEKADMLREDSLSGQVFQEMSQSQDLGDRMQFQQMLKGTPSQMMSILTNYAQKMEKTKEIRQKFVSDFDERLKDFAGPLPKAVGQQLSELAMSGYFDKKAFLIPRIMKDLTDHPATTEYLLPDSVDANHPEGIKIQSLFLPHKEFELKNKIEKMVESGISEDQIVIGPNWDIKHGAQAIAKLKLDYFKQQNGDTKLKTATPGVYVEVDDQKFKDVNGATVMPLGTYKIGNSIFVRRDALQKLKIPNEDLKSEESVTLGRGDQGLYTTEAMEFQTPYYTAKNFLTKSIDPKTGIDKMDGRRIQANQAFMDEAIRADGIFRKRSEKDIFFAKEPSEPGIFKSIFQGPIQGAVEALGRINFAAQGAVNSLVNTVMAGVHWAQGDEENRKVAWAAATATADDKSGEISWRNNSKKFDELEAMGAFENIEKFNVSPYATPAEKLTHFGGKVVGGLVVDLTEMSVVGSSLPATIPIRMAAFGKRMLGMKTELDRLVKVAAIGGTGAAAEMQALLKAEQGAVTVAHGISTMLALSTLKGHVSTPELTEAGLSGAIGAGISLYGRGARLPFTRAGAPQVIQEVEPGIYRGASKEITEASMKRLGATAEELAVIKGRPDQIKSLYEMRGYDTGAWNPLPPKDIPWFPDVSRVKASILGEVALGAVNTTRQLFEGKTPKEIAEQYKDPMFVAQMALMVVANLPGQHRFAGSDYTPKVMEKKSVIEFNNLLSKASRSESEELRFQKVVKELTTTPGIETWTVESLNDRAQGLSRKIAANEASVNEWAEFYNLTERLKDPKVGEGIIMPELAEKDKMNREYLQKVAASFREDADIKVAMKKYQEEVQLAQIEKDLFEMEFKELETAERKDQQSKARRESDDIKLKEAYSKEVSPAMRKIMDERRRNLDAEKSEAGSEAKMAQDVARADKRRVVNEKKIANDERLRKAQLDFEQVIREKAAPTPAPVQETSDPLDAIKAAQKAAYEQSEVLGLIKAPKPETEAERNQRFQEEFKRQREEALAKEEANKIPVLDPEHVVKFIFNERVARSYSDAEVAAFKKKEQQEAWKNLTPEQRKALTPDEHQGRPTTHKGKEEVAELTGIRILSTKLKDGSYSSTRKNKDGTYSIYAKVQDTKGNWGEFGWKKTDGKSPSEAEAELRTDYGKEPGEVQTEIQESLPASEPIAKNHKEVDFMARDLAEETIRSALEQGHKINIEKINEDPVFKELHKKGVEPMETMAAIETLAETSTNDIVRAEAEKAAKDDRLWKALHCKYK